MAEVSRKEILPHAAQNHSVPDPAYVADLWITRSARGRSPRNLQGTMRHGGPLPATRAYVTAHTGRPSVWPACHDAALGFSRR